LKKKDSKEDGEVAARQERKLLRIVHAKKEELIGGGKEAEDVEA
jgi:hypothetical protein